MCWCGWVTSWVYVCGREDVLVCVGDFMGVCVGGRMCWCGWVISWVYVCGREDVLVWVGDFVGVCVWEGGCVGVGG